MTKAGPHHRVMFAVLATCAVAAGVAHADVITDCKTAKSGEARITACSQIITSKTVDRAVRAEALRRRADAYAERAAHREAIADFSEALGIEPGSASALAGRAQSRLAVGETDGAISDLTDAMRIGGQSAGLLMARGYAHLLKENSDAAVADFTAVIGLSPKNASAYNNRALAYRKKGDAAKALGDYARAIDLNPAFAQAYANRGYLYEAQGDKLAAVADLARALQLDPALTGAAAGLKRLGQPADVTSGSERLIAHGRELAQKNCAWCHAIGKKGESPNPRAPRWRDLSGRHPVLALREPLSRGIARPHDEMPKFELSDAEVDTIIAYINSLSP
ncbi:cytochrome c [Hyphomicrobium sp. NDB2Meth4]|uniref:c-type cytochrome n=1 Tax=Hyphomicrobium sp. NDB2Meth4 TaxID=1892846 RepID=UPI0009F950E7|nr:cytochrome c [Hyphomicrobium sp. NDB2Meth4]